MDPVLLQSSFTIAWDSVLITLGIVAGVWVGIRIAHMYGWSSC